MPPPFQPPAAPVAAPIGLHPDPEDANPMKPDQQKIPTASQIDIHLKLSQEEADQAVEALHEAGLDQVAQMFQQAIQPKGDSQTELDQSTKALQDAVIAGEGQTR